MKSRNGAIISGNYRHILWRRWSEGPVVGFIMLNPSTADGTEDDPTVRKCMGFAWRWGMSGIVIGNVFQYRATKRSDLWKAPDPVGPRANEYLSKVMRSSSMLVAAWGVLDHPRATSIRRRFRLHHIGPLTKNGSPRHPLYLSYSEELHPW